MVVADRPMWSAQSGTSPLRTDRDALITTTATPSVSRTLRCRAITDRTLGCPASRCAERLSEPRSGISSAISPAPSDRTAPSRKTAANENRWLTPAPSSGPISRPTRCDPPSVESARAR